MRTLSSSSRSKFLYAADAGAWYQSCFNFRWALGRSDQLSNVKRRHFYRNGNEPLSNNDVLFAPSEIAKTIRLFLQMYGASLS